MEAPLSLVSTLLLACATAGTAWAQAPTSPDPGSAAQWATAAVAAGDLAWVRQDRGAARQSWRQALDLSGDEDSAAAARAMAHLRLLRTSGNLGLAIHGPRADRAISACPVDQAWCQLARADRDLIISELGMGDRRADAATRAAEVAPVLPSAAATRALWAGLPPERVALIDDADAEDADWQAVALALSDRGGAMPTGPGTWLLAVGVVGASGMGAGPLVRFSHPDLSWRGWHLDAEAWGTTAGAVQGRVGLRTRGRLWVTTGAAAGRLPVRFYDDEGTLTTAAQVVVLQARAAPGLTVGPLSTWLGPVVRSDLPAGTTAWTPGHGLFGGVGAATGRSQATLTGETTLAGPQHLEATLDLRTATPLGTGTAALRAVGAATPLSTSPSWRRQAWGGGQVLRSAPLGRLREPWLAGVVPEWRHPIIGPLGLALFGEVASSLTAWSGPVAPLHVGGGGGLRLNLPPRPLNTVRLDIGAGTLGWAVSAGMGEAF